MGLLLFAPAWARPDDPFWGMWRQDDDYFEPTIAVGPQSIIQAGNYRVTTY